MLSKIHLLQFHALFRLCKWACMFDWRRYFYYKQVILIMALNKSRKSLCLIGTNCSCPTTMPASRCDCLTTSYWDFTLTKCVARFANLTGPCTANYMCLYNSGLTCDTTVHLCKCQTANTYWEPVTQKCLLYRNYSQSCDSTYLCNVNQNQLTCLNSSSCICPLNVAAYSCDCPMTPTELYWDTTTLGYAFFVYPLLTLLIMTNIFLS